MPTKSSHIKESRTMSNVGEPSFTSTSAASFRGNDPTMEGDTPTSLAPVIMAVSVHPSRSCKQVTQHQLQA